MNPTTLLSQMKRITMLNTKMTAKRGAKSLEEPLTDDADLQRIVQTIIRDFNGSTSDYFNSMRRTDDASVREKESQEREYRIAHQFSKLV